MGNHGGNLEIANKRAKAVTFYLKTESPPSYTCVDVLTEELFWEIMPPDTSWSGTDSDAIFHTWRGTDFDVTYQQWSTYDAMAQAKPAEDGFLDSLRQRDLEFLNRSVQIVVDEGDVWTTDVKYRGHSN